MKTWASPTPHLRDTAREHPAPEAQAEIHAAKRAAQHND